MTTTLLQDIGMTWPEFVRAILDVDADVTADTFAMQLEQQVLGHACGASELGSLADYAMFVVHPFVVKQLPIWMLRVFDHEELWRNDVEEAAMVLEGKHLLEFPWHAYTGHVLHGRHMVLRTALLYCSDTHAGQDHFWTYNLSTNEFCCESFGGGFPIMIEFLWGVYTDNYAREDFRAIAVHLLAELPRMARQMLRLCLRMLYAETVEYFDALYAHKPVPSRR